MKTVGIIGGMSWESTAKYYKWLNEGVKQKLGGLHSAKILLSSLDFAPIAEMQRNSGWQEAGEILADEACKLEKAGADFIILATNTMHKVAPQIQAAISIPFLHLADATAQRIVESGIKTIGLLGTSYTMEDDFYKERLIAAGLDVVVPEKQDCDKVNSIIFEELCQGKILESSKQDYIRIIKDLFNRNAEGIILGCTEISMLVGPDDFEKPVFDTTQIHVEQAIALALS